MDILIEDVTFTPLSGKQVRCNACKEKGRRVILKQRQIPAHRGTHLRATSPPRTIPHNTLPVPPPLERTEIQEIEVSPHHQEWLEEEDMEDPVLSEEDMVDPLSEDDESQCIHCEHRFTGLTLNCPSCGKTWYR